MPERNQKVQDRLREELARNPGAGTKELQDVARGVDASVGELSLRQFNAGYVLPLKRSGRRPAKKAKTAGGGKTRGRKRSAPEAPKPQARPRGRQSAPPADDRERARSALLDFAREFSEAESRAAIVAVMSDIDRYVDRIVGSRR